ncbi:uncharacterized protein TNCV_3432171 [Trichonephila clavipes]|nr:uncharacterized protein TNCV_3432171 [Trichonephila clavipes]
MEAGQSARRIARQLGHSDCVGRSVGTSASEGCHLHEDQGLTPSTDQSSRRPPHCKKCTRTANCFIGRHPGIGSTFTRASASSRTIRRCLAEGHLGSRHPLRVLPLTSTHRRLRLKWCHARGNWTSRKSCSCVETRGKRLNPAFAFQRHRAPTAGVMVGMPLLTMHGHPYY